MPQLALTSGILLVALGLIGYFGQPVEQPVANDQVRENGPAEAAEEAAPVAPEQPVKTDKRSFTALIPAFFGLVLIGCGLLGTKESMRKHAMHAAAGIALLGGIAGLIRGVPALIGILNGDPDVNRRSMIFLWLMVAVCIAFVLAAFNSFLSARKARQSQS